VIGKQAPPVFPVNGNDIAQLLGLMPGKAMGDKLREVEKWWLAEDAKPNRQQVLDYIRDMDVRPEVDAVQEIFPVDEDD